MFLPVLLMTEWLLLDVRPLEPGADAGFLPLSGIDIERWIEVL